MNAPQSLRNTSVPRRWLVSVALVLSVGAGVATVALARGDQPSARPELLPSSSPSPSSIPAAMATSAPFKPVPSPSQATGRITGQRIYPAGTVPGDFTTCAINLATGQATCLGGDRLVYEMTLPPGQYQVYAVVPSFNPTYKAYYSRFIACGLRADCTDHTPIVVTVPAGGTVSGIDVGDFYL